jgi:hypothetical protein
MKTMARQSPSLIGSCCGNTISAGTDTERSQQRKNCEGRWQANNDTKTRDRKLLTPWSFFEKPAGSQLVKKFSAFYRTENSLLHLSLSLAKSIQSVPPHPTSWRFIFILSYHSCPGLPSGLFPSGLSTNTLTHFSYLPCVPHAPLISFSLSWPPE